MSRSQRSRLDLREQARQRVRVATRWTAVGASTLAAAFAVVLTHHTATAAPESNDTAPTTAPTTAPQQDSGQSSDPQLQAPTQAPTDGSGGGYSGHYGRSGGS